MNKEIIISNPLIGDYTWNQPAFMSAVRPSNRWGYDDFLSEFLDELQGWENDLPSSNGGDQTWGDDTNLGDIDGEPWQGNEADDGEDWDEVHWNDQPDHQLCSFSKLREKLVVFANYHV